jgi:hypothetical protein
MVILFLTGGAMKHDEAIWKETHVVHSCEVDRHGVLHPHVLFQSLNARLIDGIAAVVLGGTSLTGGEGSILNTVIGVLIWTSLGIGLNLMNISIYIRDLVRGVILLLALIFNILVQRSVQVED